MLKKKKRKKLIIKITTLDPVNLGVYDTLFVLRASNLYDKFDFLLFVI